MMCIYIIWPSRWLRFHKRSYPVLSYILLSFVKHRVQSVLSYDVLQLNFHFDDRLLNVTKIPRSYFISPDNSFHFCWNNSLMFIQFNPTLVKLVNTYFLLAGLTKLVCCHIFSCFSVLQRACLHSTFVRILVLFGLTRCILYMLCLWFKVPVTIFKNRSENAMHY